MEAAGWKAACWYSRAATAAAPSSEAVLTMPAPISLARSPPFLPASAWAAVPVPKLRVQRMGGRGGNEGGEQAPGGVSDDVRRASTLLGS
jgi:hypothetical protein